MNASHRSTEFKKLQRKDQKRIFKKISELKNNPFRHKALTGPFKECYSMHIGIYRVIYLPKVESNKIFLIDVDVSK